MPDHRLATSVFASVSPGADTIGLASGVVRDKFEPGNLGWTPKVLSRDGGDAATEQVATKCPEGEARVPGVGDGLLASSGA